MDFPALVGQLWAQPSVTFCSQPAASIVWPRAQVEARTRPSRASICKEAWCQWEEALTCPNITHQWCSAEERFPGKRVLWSNMSQNIIKRKIKPKVFAITWHSAFNTLMDFATLWRPTQAVCCRRTVHLYFPSLFHEPWDITSLNYPFKLYRVFSAALLAVRSFTVLRWALPGGCLGLSWAITGPSFSPFTSLELGLIQRCSCPQRRIPKGGFHLMDLRKRIVRSPSSCQDPLLSPQLLGFYTHLPGASHLSAGGGGVLVG